MENASKAIEDTLIPAVNYRLDPGASYIGGTRFCTFFPQGGNSYSPSGVKQIRINLSSEYGWLDPQTLRLQFTVVNDSAGTTLNYFRWLVIRVESKIVMWWASLRRYRSILQPNS